MCSSVTFLTLLSLLPFNSAFFSTTQHLAYGLALVSVCIPAAISFSSRLFAANCSARHLYRAFSMTFSIASFPLSTAQMLLHQLRILRVVAEFFTAISPRPRADASLQIFISLLPSWPDGKTVHSLPHGSKFDIRSLFAFHEPTRGRVLVQLCAELVAFPGPISYRGHLTALISAFNIQVESPSQHILRCNIV